MVTRETIVDVVVCGPYTDRHREVNLEYVDAGFDRIYVHQVGPDQDGFMRFYEREIMPTFA